MEKLEKLAMCWKCRDTISEREDVVLKHCDVAVQQLVLKDCKVMTQAEWDKGYIGGNQTMCPLFPKMEKK